MPAETFTPLVEHAAHRRCRFRNTMTVPLNEIFALIGHAMLVATPAKLLLYGRLSGPRWFRHGRRTSQSFERDIVVDLLEHVERAGEIVSS